jgi:hypothetical protein
LKWVSYFSSRLMFSLFMHPGIIATMFLPRGLVKRPSHGIKTHIRGWELCDWGPAGKYFRQLFIELSVTNREGLKSTITTVW